MSRIFSFVCALVFGLALALIAASLFPHAAHARGYLCGLTDKMEKALLEKHQETRRGMGLIGERAVMVLYLSPGGRSWTILSMSPNGRSCILGSGKHWNFPKPQDDLPPKIEMKKPPKGT